MSGFILQLVSVFLLFDGNPQNITDPTFRAYGCRTSIILRPGAGGSIPTACTVWYDASSDRESEYYVETASPRPGQVLAGCAFSFDRSQNRSDCVAPDFGQPAALRDARRSGSDEFIEPETAPVETADDPVVRATRGTIGERRSHAGKSRTDR